jgi:hypothetical protein
MSRHAVIPPRLAIFVALPILPAGLLARAWNVGGPALGIWDVHK